MGYFGGFRKHERKKMKKQDLERRAVRQFSGSATSFPQVEIIKKGKKIGK